MAEPSSSGLPDPGPDPSNSRNKCNLLIELKLVYHGEGAVGWEMCDWMESRDMSPTVLTKGQWRENSGKFVFFLEAMQGNIR